MRYLLGLYEKAMPATLGWNEKFGAARKHGFDYLEISIDETEARLSRLDNPAVWREIGLASAAAGCPIKSLCLSAQRKYPLGSPDKNTREKSLRIAAKALEMSSALGIRFVQLAGYDIYYGESTPESEKLFAEGLARITEMAAGHGVSLGFETMETAFMDTVDKAMHYVDAASSPYLQVYPDLGNLANAAALYGHNMYGDIARGRGHILAVHLKESAPGRYREVPFGTGHVDFTPACAAFLQQGVRLFVGEFWHTGSESWEADLSAAAVFLRGHLNTASETVRRTQNVKAG